MIHVLSWNTFDERSLHPPLMPVYPVMRTQSRGDDAPHRAGLETR